MRKFQAIPWLLALSCCLSFLACVEVFPEPTPPVGDGLRSIAERSILPRPADGQTWLVTTAYLAEEGMLPTGGPMIGLGDGDTEIELEAEDAVIELDEVDTWVNLDDFDPAAEWNDGRPKMDLDDAKPVIELDEDEGDLEVDGDEPAVEREEAITDEVVLSRGVREPDLPVATHPEIESDSITWEFHVLDSDYLPDEESVFYSLTLDDRGNPQRVTILEVVLFAEWNTGSQAKELSPTFQLVLRRSDYRLLALQVSCLVHGIRTTRVVDPVEIRQDVLISELESNRILPDFVLPRFPLEDAQEQTTEALVDRGGVEVAFTSATGGDLVVQRWDPGQPWFTYSRSDDRFSWLGSVR